MMVANCARAVPTEYSLSASDPLTSSTLHLLKSANKRTPASHQLHRTHQPLPQSGIAQLSCFQKRLLTPHQCQSIPHCCHIFFNRPQGDPAARPTEQPPTQCQVSPSPNPSPPILFRLTQPPPLGNLRTSQRQKGGRSLVCESRHAAAIAKCAPADAFMCQ